MELHDCGIADILFREQTIILWYYCDIMLLLRAQGKHRDGAARFWQVDGRQSRGRGYLCEHSHRQGLQVPLAASETSVLSCRRVV